VNEPEYSLTAVPYPEDSIFMVAKLKNGNSHLWQGMSHRRHAKDHDDQKKINPAKHDIFLVHS